jgi:hypothetical protein
VAVVSELGWVLIGLASAVAAANITAIVVARAFYRRVRRKLALSSAPLRARARLSYGRHGEVLKLRVRLKETIDSGQAAIDIAARTDGHRGELPRLFDRLKRESVALESQLRLLESENDSTVLDEALPTARSRVDDVAHLVRRLRSAVASGLGSISEDSLTALRSEVDREVIAVRAGLQELRDLNERGAFYQPIGRPAADLSPRNRQGSES